MEQEPLYRKIGIVGCGAAGGLLSILLSKNPYNNVYAFDVKPPFSTLLPTGGGRCNISNAIEDVMDFVKNYPRGEKFLISIFSRFSPAQTLKLFEDLGVKTYVQDDNRVFPISDSSVKTIQTLRTHLHNNFYFIKEKATNISIENNRFKIYTGKKQYHFDKIIIASGGLTKDSGIYKFIKTTGHNIIELKPSLCALDIEENYLYKLSGLGMQNIEAQAVFNGKKYPAVSGGFLFAHKFITGPLIFKISAITAYENFNESNPLEIIFKLTSASKEEIEHEMDINSKKTIKNVFSKFIPENLAEEILKLNSINPSKQTSQLKKTEKEIIINSLTKFKLHAYKRIKDSEIVTAGGVDTKEINPKTMESKIIPGLYFIGEILNVDGFTGGFNLQSCWSEAYICSLNFL